MNIKSKETQSAILALLRMGYGIREVAELMKVSRQTVRRYQRIYGGSARCRCGKGFGHLGWCHKRFMLRSIRQEFMRRWHPEFRPPYLNSMTSSSTK